MTTYRIIPATLEHVDEILKNIRPEDVKEIERATDLPVKRALELSVRTAWEAIAGYADDELVLLAGVSATSMLHGVGCPWCVGTPALKNHAMKMCRENRRYIKRWLEVFPRLENWVDEENVVSQRWLKWLSFELEEPVSYGKQGALFRHFYQDRKE